MSGYITSIATANPAHEISQEQALEFMIRMNALNDDEAHRLRLLYRASGIKTRYSVLSDYAKSTNLIFYPNGTNEPAPGTAARMRLYNTEALRLSTAAAKKCLANTTLSGTDITHLITVSCTGLHAPGLDLQLMEPLGLKNEIKRTAINFMGCYAAFNALKLAEAFCSAGSSKVLIVCTELCSIHFQKGKDDDNMLANALFGDGSAAVLMETETLAAKSIVLEDAQCDLLPNGIDEMVWGVGDFGFEMKLSAYVPDVIEKGIDHLLERYDRSFDFYAIHPGGKKILQVIETALNIDRHKNHYAHEVLRKYGNMSSPTVLFVLSKIFEPLTVEDENKTILAMAFGPGITLESMVLKVNISNA